MIHSEYPISFANSGIFGFQSDTVWEDVSANCERLEEQVVEADPPPGALLVFPEMATAGFTMKAEKVAEASDGPSMNFFSRLARGRQCHVVAGMPLREEDGSVGNVAVVLRPDGSEAARYRKRRPFPLIGEKEHYPAGGETVIVECGDWRLAPFICYDLRFPELFREAVLRDANLFVVIANWPAARIDHWFTLLRARAIENQCYIVGVNRCGTDPNFEFPGSSLVIDPKGEIIARAEDGIETIQARPDFDLLKKWRSEFPALVDAAPSAAPAR